MQNCGACWAAFHTADRSPDGAHHLCPTCLPKTVVDKRGTRAVAAARLEYLFDQTYTKK